MQFLIVLSAALALANATPGYLGAGAYSAYAAPAYSAYAAPAYTAYAAPASFSSQYHAQDELGQYSYGHSGGPSAKQETRTLDGITRGGYSYVDGYGLVQSASYVSDPVNGFRVAATNLPVGPAAPVHTVAAYAAPAVHAAYGTTHLVDPVAIAAGAPLPVGDTVEVAAAKAAHFQAHVDAKAGLLGRKKRSPGYLGAGVAAYAAPAIATYAAPAVATYAAPVAVAAPVRSFGYSTVSAHAAPAIATYAAPAVATYAAPVAVAAPVRSFGYSTVSAHATPVVAAYAAPVAHAVVSGSNQYQAQDTLGQYSYGYADGNSAKHETRAFDGTTHGGYSYVDGNGLVQSVKYHADALGFRAHGTNFPVAA